MLRLDTLADTLKEKLENPGAVLEVLVTALAKGHHHPELWEDLHRAVARDELGAELAFAYEHLAQDKRTKLIAPALQAELFMHAAAFFGDVFGDIDGAISYAERGQAAVPGNPAGVAVLERLLHQRRDFGRLARLYVDAAANERDRGQQLELLRRAARALENVTQMDDLGIEIHQRILRLEPTDAVALSALEARFLASGKHREAAKLLEQALLRYADSDASESLAIRSKLLALYTGELGEPQRAVPHVEALLTADPNHQRAREVAESLLEHRGVASRAAAALSDAYERLGQLTNAAEMLTRELKLARGQRRTEVQRRLAIMRQDALGDPAGALELLGPAVLADPNDDELRRRFVELSITLNQPLEAARLLARAVQAVHDEAVMARVGVEIGQVYLVSGDVRSALTAFQQVVDAGGDESAVLFAARRLADLHAEAGDLKKLSEDFELVVKLEPDLEARRVAARRLAKLSDTELFDQAKAIAAYQLLVDSQWADEALGRLTSLYEETGNQVKLAEVLERRAERAADPEEAQKFALRAADLRSARPSDRPRAIQSWQTLLSKFGPSRDVHARLIPLLEQEREWGTVSELLMHEIELVPEEERPALWSRIGQIKLVRLHDDAGAVAAFRHALMADPHERVARSAMERLLASGDQRLEAAEILEHVYRAEHSSSGLVRVLAVRGELGTDVQARLQSLDEALWIVESELGNREQALAIAGRGLALAVAQAPNALPEWLSRVQALAAAAGDPAARAQVFVTALGDHKVNSAEFLELARVTAEALVVSGEITRAIEIYRRALSFDPSSAALLERIDELLIEQGNPAERLALYRSALEQPCDPSQRRELLHATARLQRQELGDLSGAVATWQTALEQDPRDQTAHQALLEIYSEQGDWRALLVELERGLDGATGERRAALLEKLGETLAEHGDHARALGYFRELMHEVELGDERLGRIEALAQEQGDLALVSEVLERRIAAASEAEVRVGLYQRLGDALAQGGQDADAASRAWREAARIAEEVLQNDERAASLYERVLGLVARDMEAADRVFGVYARMGAWHKLEGVFELLLDQAQNKREPVARALGIEAEATRAGAAPVFVALLDAALQRCGPDRGLARELKLAKARALQHDPSRHDEIAAVLREALATAEADGPVVAEAFERFLADAAPTPARIEDRRWLFGWRIEHSNSPVNVLLAWARHEEELWNDPGRAVELFERAHELDPRRADVLSELARLQQAQGDPEGALATLKSLSQLSQGEARAKVDLRIAALLLEPLGRGEEALQLAEGLVETAPTDPEVLRIVNHALGQPALRAKAAELLERAAESGGDPRARAEVLTALLSLPAESRALAEARQRWFTRLLECKADDPEAMFDVAVRGALEEPEGLNLWTAAERLARRLNRPGPVADAFANALERELSPSVAEALGRRMVEFHEEWFEEPDRVITLLRRVLALCPTATWAFDRLKLAFNSGGRWGDLFELYDHRLASADADEKIAILREGAMAAKDFAGDSGRAIGYLEQLSQLCPADTAVEASLERLYEREGRKRSLIDLLMRRLSRLGAAERQQLRLKIAGLWLDIDDALSAHVLLSEMLSTPEPSPSVYQLLERLVALPASRTAALPAGKAKGRRDSLPPTNVRDAAARMLRDYYEKSGQLQEVARILEVLLESASGVRDQVRRLNQIVELRLQQIGDEAGAFQNVAQLVTLEPSDAEHRRLLADLGERIEAQAARAELLSAVGRDQSDTGIRASLLREAADVYDRALGDPDSAIALHFEVLKLAGKDRDLALAAARDLDRLLEATGRSEEHCSVLEQRAALERDRDARRVALANAARVAEEALHDPKRAMVAWQTRLRDDPADVEALDGLASVLDRAGQFADLVGALRARADLRSDPAEARPDLVRIARIHADQLMDRGAAVDSWYLVRERCGPDAESFSALLPLLEALERWNDLARLVSEEAARESDQERCRNLQQRLGDLHRHHTGDLGAALRAFVAAGEWQRAVEAAGADGVAKDVGLRACQDLLDLAVAEWTRVGETATEAARATAWAITELGERLRGAGNHDAVVALLLRGAELPFSLERQRELRREAACVCSDQLGDTERAIHIFRGLFAEDPNDAVAAASVTRLALLLEERGLWSEIAELWEQQARSRAASGNRPAAAALWTRAAEIWAARLGDLDRAVANYHEGAGLGGETALEELARIHEQRGDHRRAAEALEWLCAQSSREALAARALRLAEAYVAIQQRPYARARLEWAAQTALDTGAVRRRLAELYREDRDWGPLAELLSAEATRAPDPKTRLNLLTEAAHLHLEKRNQPAAAVPLLEQAVDLEPDEPSLRLDLSRALERAGRFDEASSILRKQIEHYGSRRPKDRALVHFQLARVSLAAGRRAEAMTELGLANRIDPAHPGILQALARLAFEEQQYDKAERMYRALLLVLKPGEPEMPSRAEALLDLSQIAQAQDDAVRAGEFIESAFECALEREDEAVSLERALRTRGSRDLLARAVHARLEHASTPEQAARALGDLAMLQQELETRILELDVLEERARRVHQELEQRTPDDDQAWAALGTVYAALGNTDANLEVLERRVAHFAIADDKTADPSAFYQLAEIRLRDPLTRDRGVDLLERAVGIHADVDRAEAMLGSVAGEDPQNERVIRLLEWLARTTGREHALAEALARVSRLPTADAASIHEGVELAKRLGDGGLLRSMLDSATGLGLPDDDAAWVRRELADQIEKEGNLEAALSLREQAAEYLPASEARPLLLDVARQTAVELGDPEKAAHIYESLLENEPADRQAWEPLLEIYRKFGAKQRLIALIEQTVPLVEAQTDRARLRLEQASIMLEQPGQTDAAADILQDILSEDPSQHQAAIVLSAILEKSGRHDELVGLLAGQLERAKERSDLESMVSISVRMGSLLEQQGRSDDAFHAYQAAVSSNPKSRPALEANVRLAEKKGDAYVLANALEGLLRVAEGEEAVQIAARLVSLRVEQRDAEAAERALELGFAAAPSNAMLREGLIARYRKRNDFARIAGVLERATMGSPNEPALIRQLIESYHSAGQPEQALTALQGLIGAEPDNDDLYRERATLLIELGRDEEAISDLERAYQKSGSYRDDLVQALDRAMARAQPPRDHEIRMRLLEILEEAGDTDGVRQRLLELIKSDPKDSEALRRLAILETRAENWAQASTAYRRLIALEEGDALVEVALKLADTCERADRFADARGGLERALKVAPANIDLRERLRQLYHMTGENRELARMLEEDAANEGDVSQCLAYLLAAGELWLAPDGDPAEGIRVLEQALKLSSESLEAIALLARALAAGGRRDEAIRMLDDAASANRGKRGRPLAYIHREISNLQVEEGRMREAVESMNKALDLDLRNGPLAVQLGELAMDAEDYDTASRAFRTVAMMKSLNPESLEGASNEQKADANYYLAWLSYREGDVRKAKVFATKAVAKNPEHEQALALLAQIDAG